eukprot:g18799.t1
MLGVLAGSDCGTCWAFATSAQMEAQLALTKRDGVLRRVDLGEVISCTSREERMKRNKFNGVPISAVTAKDLPVERLCTDGNIQTWVYAYTTQNGVRLLSSEPEPVQPASGAWASWLWSSDAEDETQHEMDEHDQRGGDQVPYPSMRYPTNTYDDRQQDVPFRYTNPRSEQAEASVPPPGDRDKYCQQQRQFEEFGGDKQQWILDKRPLPGDSVGSLEVQSPALAFVGGADGEDLAFAQDRAAAHLREVPKKDEPWNEETFVIGGATSAIRGGSAAPGAASAAGARAGARSPGAGGGSASAASPSAGVGQQMLPLGPQMLPLGPVSTPNYITHAEQKELQNPDRLTEVTIMARIDRDPNWHATEVEIRAQLQKMPVVGLVDARGLKKFAWGPRWNKHIVSKEDFPSYSLTGSLHLKGDHYVQIVGLRRCPETDVLYWWIKNSWGPDWGDNGYFRLKYGEGLVLHGVTIQPRRVRDPLNFTYFVSIDRGLIVGKISIG